MFAGLYPVEANQYEAMREALEKLQLNDASLQFEPEVSQALGFGFRCGFLGLLHMDIVQERLEREFDMDLITTAPTVVYEVLMRDGTVLEVENPSKMPDPGKIEEIREPIVSVTIFTPQEYVGNVITLCTDKRGVQTNLAYHGRQVHLHYELPMNEIVLDFFDKLKSTSRGYASMDYEFKEYRASDVVKLDILVNGDKVDALSLIVHRSVSQSRGREVAAKMRELIPRQMYDVAIQAAIGSEHHRARERQGAAQERAGQVLRRRHLAQEEAAREAEGRQEAHEAGRHGRDPAGGLPGGAAGRRSLSASGPGRRPRCDSRALSLNFALILFLLLLVTFVAWLAGPVLVPAPAPRGSHRPAWRSSSAGRRALPAAPAWRRADAAAREAIAESALRQPVWLEYTAGLFPVIAVVFLLRSFLVEPFKIPSGIDDPDAAGRRPDPREQVQLRRSPAGGPHQGVSTSACRSAAT